MPKSYDSPAAVGAVSNASPPSAPSDNVLQKGAWMVLLAAFLGWMFDGLEMGIHPLVAYPALGEFYQTAAKADTAWAAGVTQGDYIKAWNGYITALFLIGAALGGFVFGWLGDKIGRVKSMTLSILFYSGFTGLCYFANTPWQMGGLRFLAALGMGGEWSLGVALVMEAWPSKHRPLLAGLIGAAANVGFMLIAAVVAISPTFFSGADRWRWILVAGAMPAALTFIIRIFVPESEKWQHSVAVHGTGSPLIEVLGVRWIHRTLLAVGLAGVALIGTWASVQNIPTWVSDRMKVEMRTANAVAQSVDPADKAAFEKVTLSQDQDISVTRARANTQIFSAIGAILGCLCGPLLGAFFSRRMAYALLCATSFASCYWIFNGFDAALTPLFDFAVGLVGFTTASFYGWLPLYLPELFATRIRATGQGIAFNFGRIIAAVGALYTGDLAKAYGWDGMGSTLSWIYIAGIVLILFAPETKGKPLPE